MNPIENEARTRNLEVMLAIKDAKPTPAQANGSQEPPQMQGWECPRCRTIHSPFVLECGCQPPVEIRYGTGTTSDD